MRQKDYEIEFFLYGGGRSYEFKPTLKEARDYVRQETKLKWLKVIIHYPETDSSSQKE